jgi:hypothetical protein
LKRLWTTLRDEVARHERFSNAQWTLKDEQLEPLRVLANKYEPDDPVALVAPLFDSFALDETNDLATANRRRAEAFRRLYDSHGADAVLRLAAEARVPYLAVEAAAGAGLKEGEVESLLRSSFRQHPTSPLTLGLSGHYRGLVGLERAEVWVRLNAADASPDVVSGLLRAWPDGPSTWNVVRRLGAPVVASYWQRQTPRFVKGSKRTLIRAALMYLRFGRAIEAIQSSLDRLAEIPTELIFRMLDGVILEVNSSNVRADTMTSHYVEKAFEALDHRNDAPLEKISQLEYAFLPLLEYNGSRSLRIHRLMATSPDTYHQILRNAFKGKHEVAGDLSEDVISRARRSYSLLTRFSDIPGLSAEGVDEHTLGSWIDEVRRMGTETDRAGVTDNFIGRLLAHSPPDLDGGWPHKAVRTQVERIQSEELERGLQLERFNMRGIHGKQIFEGGAQERALADENTLWADITAAWPRTSALLRAIAKSWRADAERADTEAAQRMLRS